MLWYNRPGFFFDHNVNSADWDSSGFNFVMNLLKFSDKWYTLDEGPVYRGCGTETISNTFGHYGLKDI